mgnify:CR=1 FL=1
MSDKLVGTNMARNLCCGKAAIQTIAKVDHCQLSLVTINREALVVTCLIRHRKDVLAHINQSTREIT